VETIVENLSTSFPQQKDVEKCGKLYIELILLNHMKVVFVECGKLLKI